MLYVNGSNGGFEAGTEKCYRVQLNNFIYSDVIITNLYAYV